ncbi:hypothetical protein [Psychromonas aquatilis]|uniref:Beta-barrel assembly machine subunit BamE n=1 Tax=Psychromonas aquatilis TaxID=2005072 RepID=A0ABU9GNH3_9GAMM
MNIKIITAAIVMATLSGCAVLEKNTVEESSLQAKASMALGVKPENINVSNIQGGLQKITFDAVANGNEYSCYYTTALIVKSDALCTEFGSTEKEDKVSQCDALSSAAGKC